MSQKLPISVIIHTKNSGSTLLQCLKSVEFAQEIVVVDMGSTDNTKQIASQFETVFVSVEDKGYGYADPVRNLALEKASQAWVLVVDSDEEVSETLKKWIEEQITKKEVSAVAYKIPRRNFMFGLEVHHTGWWPDYQIRFFKKGTVSWPTEVHGVPKVEGELAEIPAKKELALIHHNYASVEQFVERMNRYTTATAKEEHHIKDFSGKTFIQTFREEFSRRMFVWKGIEDGGLGVSLSFLQSTYQLLVQLKRWERDSFSQHEKNDLNQTMAEVKNFSNELQYWYLTWQVEQHSGLSKIYWQVRRKLLLSF